MTANKQIANIEYLKETLEAAGATDVVFEGDTIWNRGEFKFTLGGSCFCISSAGSYGDDSGLDLEVTDVE